MDRIRVGIVGASPERGWAADAHIPALRALPEYELTAVGTSRPDSAREAARAFGAAHAFTDARRLAEHPEVDLVAVTVKVAAHAELVGAALEAGKHVYCEWPLGLTTGEAERLAAAARAAGVHDAVGLQARYAPAITYARELLAGGRLGPVTAVNVHVARSKGADGRIPAWAAYTLDETQRAGLLEVVGGHTLDVLEYLAGDLTGLSAALSVSRPRYTVAETGETVTATAPDQVALHGGLAGGAIVSVHLQDAKVGKSRTVLEFTGTEGDLAVVVAGDWKTAQVQMGEPRLREAHEAGGPWRDLPVPARHTGPARHAGAPGEIPLFARNVARLYAHLAEDIREGTRRVPGFEHGVRVHRLLDAVRRSAETGASRPVDR
ncbi:Gfo/Idh/MocA family protein [Actinoallomurus soli]|uniref:Gfo/Idh/MocA family protein n=1 Tax=Actinoallomurus soli TaxID=2952535 RepID=UPI002093C340|nr:Gfo/Idh/MocA family oxidoreductase [Actinoallomurus soli]MCO5974559.1 Gfo/Idh/MocA family oxidoreductase [Actinoallomurus soli]